VPEGHSVHRIARQFRANFLDVPVQASSPQGRFTDGAAVLSGQRMVDVFAVGKQMFAQFERGDWLRVHLGIYGAWDFAGDIKMDATISSANGRMGQTNQRGTVLDTAGENSVTSIGAPRLARMRMSEQSKLTDADDAFPPEPVGAVRLRLLTTSVCADLRGPTACEILTDAEVDAVINKLGPDPQHDSSDGARDKFVMAVRKRSVPVGQLLMDQSVVAGIGNVYRAEMLFRARIDPHRAGNTITLDEAQALWVDWISLLSVGIDTGQMMTMDGLSAKQWKAAMASRDERHWVYKREGLPCRVCGTNIALAEMQNRKLYWCPSCQT
jgi:formamidopyrimidine-DNA glycosylase